MGGRPRRTSRTAARSPPSFSKRIAATIRSVGSRMNQRLRTLMTPGPALAGHDAVEPRDRQIEIPKKSDAGKGLLRSPLVLIAPVDGDPVEGDPLVVEQLAVLGDQLEGPLPGRVVGPHEETEDQVATRRQIELDAWTGAGRLREPGRRIADLEPPVTVRLGRRRLCPVAHLNVPSPSSSVWRPSGSAVRRPPARSLARSSPN